MVVPAAARAPRAPCAYLLEMAAPKAPALFRAEHLPLLETLPFVLCAAYVFLCPFHKVEESFHLQVRP
jgi:hypothetical protein